MIQHFEKIENLGVFANYKKPVGMDPFQRYNLIYGLNGSGKTTLSRFFADLNNGQATGFPDLKYKIKTEDGEFQQGNPYTRKVRVFNAEYVAANIGELDGTLNPIYVIGEESKTLAETVKADEALHSTLEKEKAEKETALQKLERKKGKFFTDVAPKIIETAKGAVTRTYNKRNAEKAYEGLVASTELTVEELADASKAMKQAAMEKLSERATPQIRIGQNDYPLFEALDLQCEVVMKLLQKSAISAAIGQLKSNPALAAWVESGRELHAHNDDQKCEYCLQIIPDEREADLAAHFTKSDSILKGEIEDAIAETTTFIEEVERITGLSEKLLYPEFRVEFFKNSKVLCIEQEKISTQLGELEGALRGKLARRTESYVETFSVVSDTAWNSAQLSLNSLIRKHNGETDGFQKRLDSNFVKIETHFLSTIDQDVRDTVFDIKTVTDQIKVCTDGDAANNKLGIEGLSKRIRDNRAKISNSHQAAADLSQKLSSFLGRDDLKFMPEGEGYRIERFGRPAKRLSEGEKTAITFLYFVVGLTDQDFDLAEGIVVIDDPISSLDSSSVYQAFSYLKNAVKDAKQVFLLTHNFDFLKILLNWFQNIPKPAQNGKSTYWMLHCSVSGATSRETEIKKLDKVLRQNKNEFAYLIKELAAFKSDGEIATAYPIPNMIRKVLETFLEQHSTGGNLYQKLENLTSSGFEPTKKTALLKFANDMSHPTFSGIDPSLVEESKNNISHLLELIEHVAPIHYKALTDTIGSNHN